MSFFYKLNLPGNPLVDGAVEQLIQIKRSVSTHTSLRYNTQNMKVEEFFRPDVLQTFNSIELIPQYFVHFGVIDLVAKTSTTFLHSDVVRQNQQWISVPCGINWELTQGYTNFRWYDTHKLSVSEPKVGFDTQPGDFTGLHYGGLFNRDTSNCTLLEQLHLQRETAYLVRTDIPHQVTALSTAGSRISISLRFSVDSIATWQQAEQQLSSLIIH